MLKPSGPGTLISAALALALVTAPGYSMTRAEQAPPAQPGQTTAPTRLIGTVNATSANSLSLKLENGSEVRVDVNAQTKVVRTAPGATSLAGAAMIHVEDLETGDRVSVRLAPGSDPTHYAATAIITMKQADIAQAHASQSEDWQKRGVSGVVKSIEPVSAGNSSAAGESAIVVGTTQPGHNLTIQVTPATIIRRYAPDSVNFADARPSTLSEIHVGDQLRARGDRSVDRSSVNAVEIVAGSFRNVAGTVVSINTAQNTLIVTDLATKKALTLKLTGETQMRKLPLEMAQRLAARTGAGSEGSGRPVQAPAPGTGSFPAAAQGPNRTSPNGTAAGAPGSGGQGGEAETRPHADPAAMLQRAPAVTLAELKKGDAIMVVATRNVGGQPDEATAITLIAGVEPLLQGSSNEASQNLFSASWNLGGGAVAEATP